jgi:GT2 family glycosyltransferase
METGGGRGPFISVIVPNHNGRRTVGKCLEAALASRYPDFEVIVVDDCSGDGSVEIIEQYPCRLIRLSERGGASKARNAGARDARGEALFFIDSDCVVMEDTLAVAARAFTEHRGALIGGTYTPLPLDRGFFSDFQSVYINYSETKKPEPDYVATHAMLMDREMFLKSGGFREEFMPILEDVEFSHRLKGSGVRLVMAPGLLVRHIFNFSLIGSLRNAFRKSMYWTMYSLESGDLFRDSGTASVELKANTLSWLVCIFLLLLYAANGSMWLLYALAAVCCLNLALNRGLIRALYRARGVAFVLAALLYYTTLYPVPVGLGGSLAALRRR